PFAPWRAIYELFHPLPSKRQGYVHTWARQMRGALRAPPGGLAEITATQVPGERVLAGKSGGWGREIPLVDDLLSLGFRSGTPVALATAAGTTLIVPPRAAAAPPLASLPLTLPYPRY